MQASGLLDAGGAERVRPLLSEGKPLDEALVSSGVVSEEQALKFLAEKFGVTYLDLAEIELKKDFLAKFPVRILLKHRLVPISIEDGTVLVASSRMFDTTGLDELRIATGLDCRLALAP